MTIDVLGSGSSGNCYLLNAANETLIIEAGIRFADIKKALNFSFANVVGVVVSHRHGDHAKSVGDFLNFGINVYSNADVCSLFKSHFVHQIDHLKAVKIGGFKVVALDALHDVPCSSFVIQHNEMGKLLFMTDSVSFDYSIKNLDHVMIEANYEDHILEDNIQKGIEPASMRGRLLQSHCELHNAINVVKAQQCIGNIQSLVLVHLSSRNSDAEQFKTKTEKETGIPTTIATNGTHIDLL